MHDVWIKNMRWNLQILNISLGIHSLTKAYDIYEGLAEGGEDCHFCKDVCHYKLYKTAKKKKKAALGHNKPNKHVPGFIKSYDFQIWPKSWCEGWRCDLTVRSFFLPLSLRGCNLPEWPLSPHPLGCMKNSPGLPIRVSLNQGAGVTAATRMTLLSLGI